MLLFNVIDFDIGIGQRLFSTNTREETAKYCTLMMSKHCFFKGTKKRVISIDISAEKRCFSWRISFDVKSKIRWFKGITKWISIVNRFICIYVCKLRVKYTSSDINLLCQCAASKFIVSNLMNLFIEIS